MYVHRQTAGEHKMNKHTVSAHDTKEAAERRVEELNTSGADAYYYEIGSGTYRHLVKRSPWAGGNSAAVRAARLHSGVFGAVFNA